MPKKVNKQRLSLKNYLSVLKNNAAIYNSGNENSYVEKPKGKYYIIRTWVSFLFFAIFVSLPLIYYNGKPFILLNFIKSEFIVYGQVFEPSEFYFFGITLILFAAFIIIFTSIFGRIFCGWICPQTVLMEMLFRKIEYLIEGNLSNQIFDQNSPEKSIFNVRKTIKHIVFFIISFLIANILLSYIIGYKELFEIINDSVNNHISGLSGILIFSSILYFIFGFYRQKTCINFCPYSRLQNVLFDKNTLLIAYDYKRGEPRGVIENEMSKIKIGDCIDCCNCIKVCPMGIDIRNGIQRECIMCTSCVDACNSVMFGLKKPKSLIKFTTENLIEFGSKPSLTLKNKINLFLMTLISFLIFYIIFSR